MSAPGVAAGRPAAATVALAAAAATAAAAGVFAAVVLGGGWRGGRKGATAGRGDAALNAGIAHFYDQSSGLWEKVWGEHMHHGHYGADGSVRKEHRQAQADMIEETLRWAGAPAAGDPGVRAVLDVGCGIGGSARSLLRRYPEATAEGVTLSPVQCARAAALSAAQGLGSRAAFRVEDALNLPYPDDSFDLVWSMESGEHMPDKRRFVSELARVCRPGGRIIVVTWCHRDTPPDLRPAERRLLDAVCRCYYLPEWCSVSDYVSLLGEAGLGDVRSDDWTPAIRPFWRAVIASALTPAGFVGLLFSTGWATLRGAWAMVYMVRGYRMGVIRFGVLTATKASY